MDRGSVEGSVVVANDTELDIFQETLYEMGPRKYADIENNMDIGTELAPGIVTVITRGIKKALRGWAGNESDRAEFEEVLAELQEKSKPMPTPEELDAMIEADPDSAQLIEKLKELSKTPGLIESYLLLVDPPIDE